ncbi:hypothetical protein GCK72_007376 [Caenorhabditis remanei]|uniref:BTB domain-containing protein n=1 Tax=Caenorhabditis remanei TaxID=31234 RepID=A0A6A5HLT9_CAERE|nr:hypothetical protein GCK72_007376 [Caenorhabditis remanei]KAF1767417.1 hypothetical protein GCK72_007376 [Caenorhabditis remanei]
MSEANEKRFVIKHVFKNISRIESGQIVYGSTKEHFGYNWTLSMSWERPSTMNYIKLMCEKVPNDSTWSIETTINSEMLSKMGKESEIHKFSAKSTPEVIMVGMYYEHLRHLTVNGDLEVEINVKINEVQKEKLRNFDEAMKEFSDVVLIVEDEKFYVSKLFLASHCTYFNSLFFGNFGEADKSEVEIKEIQAEDFQNFLELINGESFVDDYTVNGLLQLADFFDSKTAFRRCEEFLMNSSKKSVREKVGLAIKYNIDKLKEKCISSMKTVDEVHSVLPEVSSHVADSVWKELLMKTLSFSK